MTQQIIAMALPRTQRVCEAVLADLHWQLTPFYTISVGFRLTPNS
jgi:hypothetical protein